MLVGLHYSTILPLAGAALLGASIAYAFLGRGGYQAYARLGFALIAAGWVPYAAAFLRLDYSLAEVARNANNDLDALMRLGASWAGGGGSLYLYAVILSLASLYLLRGPPGPGLRVYALSAAALTLAILASAALNGAFETVDQPVGGFGINPLLKSPWLIPHPLTTFGGYSLLLTGSLALLTLPGSRRGLAVFLLGWALLSLGITLGGMWSYETFGWGGYWAWDPVEVSELTVWLSATAALHAAGPLATLRAPLAALTGSSALLAPYVTRSGLSPLHSFAAANIGSVLLLASSLALLAVSAVELAWAASGEGLAGRIRGALFTPRIQDLSLTVAGLAITAMAAFTYASLLAPSVLTALGMGASVPTMEEGVRFYHTILYPLYLAALIWIPGYFLPGVTPRGFAVYTIVATALGATALAGVRYGALEPLPGAPPSTNYQAALGLAFASTALAALLVSIAWPLASRGARGAGFRDYALKLIHTGMVLTFIGVLLSGTYAFNDSYFKTYTLKPGEAVDVAGVRLELVGYEFQVNPGTIDLRGHVGPESLIALTAWHALELLKSDVAPTLREVLEVESTAGANETVKLLRELAVNHAIVHLGPLEVSTGNATVEVSDVRGSGWRARYSSPVTLRAADATLETILAPLSSEDGTLAGGVVGLAVGTVNLTIRAQGLNYPPGAHTVISIKFQDPVRVEAGGATIEVSAVEVYASAPAPGLEPRVWVTEGEVVIENAVIYIDSCRVTLGGGILELPVNLSRGLYLYLQAATGRAALLRDLMESPVRSVFTSDGILSLAAGDAPGAPGLPAAAPSGVSLNLRILVDDGSERAENVRIRFEANGEASGIHGLVTPTLVVRRGVSDVYIHVYPPTVEGHHGSYHELLVFYVKTLTEELPPSQALSTAALLAAGYHSSTVAGSTLDEAAVTVAATVMDLYLLAEKFNPGNSTITSRGVSVAVKVVPGVNLVWAGAFMMAASAAASSLYYAWPTRRPRA